MAAENTYPLLTFSFIIEWGGSRLGVQEISGLNDVELEKVPYREGNSLDYHDTYMPGRPKYGELTLKRGMLSGDDEFHQWISTVRLNKIDRRDLTISLLDEEHNPVFVWQALAVWPSKLEGPSLNSTSNEVAVESITLCLEKLTRVSA
jgi:phage tail-like protein